MKHVISEKKDFTNRSDDLFDFSEYKEYVRDDPIRKRRRFSPEGEDDEKENTLPTQPPRPPPWKSKESQRNSYTTNVDQADVHDEFVCPHYLFTCSNKECVNRSSRCDGKQHCTDGSDEWDCGRADGEL